MFCAVVSGTVAASHVAAGVTMARYQVRSRSRPPEDVCEEAVLDREEAIAISRVEQEQGDEEMLSPFHPVSVNLISTPRAWRIWLISRIARNFVFLTS